MESFGAMKGMLGIGEGVNAEIIRSYIKNQGWKVEQLKLVDFAS